MKGVNGRQERTNLIMAPWLFLGRLRPVIARARTSRRATGPTFQATTDRRPTDRPTRRRRGSPRDASRLRAVVRLRCEPLRFANSVGLVRPRAPRSSPSARINPRRSAIVGARARAIVGTRDFSPPSLSPPHWKKRRRARERSSSVSRPSLSQWPANDRAVAIVTEVACDDVSV